MFHWENGLKLTTADLAIDFRRRQPRAFISHAHSDHMARHEFALCTPETAALYQLRLGPRRTLELPYRQTIDWAGLRLTTYPAGHCLGSAMLLAEDQGRTLLYTGDFKLRPSLTAEPAELPHADTLVIESTYGHPDYRLPPREESLAEFFALVRRALAEEMVPVIQGYVLGKSQEITRLLTDAGIPVLQHRSIYEVSRMYESLGCPLGRFERFRGRAEPGWAVIVPPGTPLTGPSAAGPFRPDRLGHGPRGQVSSRRRSCHSAFRPRRLRRVDRGDRPRRPAGRLLHPRAREFCRSAPGSRLQRPRAGQAAAGTVVLARMIACGEPRSWEGCSSGMRDVMASHCQQWAAVPTTAAKTPTIDVALNAMCSTSDGASRCVR